MKDKEDKSKAEVRRSPRLANESVSSFAVKYALGILLLISVYINILSHQSNELLKMERDSLKVENAIIMHEGAKLYKSYETLLEFLQRKIEEELEREERRRGGLEA